MMATVACRDIDKLTPETKILCLRFLDECKKQGLNIGISETWRSAERQKEMIAKGASKIARSKHQDGLAFDFYNNQGGNLYPDDIIRKCGAIGKKLGLYWGGDFKGFYDSGHLENDNPVGTIKDDDTYLIAVNKLAQKGVISSPDVWKNITQANVKVDNVKSLIIKFASKL
jgi:peptidoglycan L-alanyl-D-glutamate endopeptidase CwlK